MEGGYHALEIYRLAHQLAVEVHKMTLTLPKYMMFEEAGQVRKSSKSVSSQIVEGYALRKYKNEYLHYLWRGYASSEETQEHLVYLTEITSDPAASEALRLLGEYKVLCAKIFRFIQSIEKKLETPNFLKEPLSDYDAEDLNPEP